MAFPHGFPHGFRHLCAEPLQPGPEGRLRVAHTAGSGDRQLQLLRGRRGRAQALAKNGDFMVILEGSHEIL
jgi:hypothetical protein